MPKEPQENKPGQNKPDMPAQMPVPPGESGEDRKEEERQAGLRKDDE